MTKNLSSDRTRSSLEAYRSSGSTKSTADPYKGHVIDAKSVPVDGGWMFTATVTKNGRVRKSVAASGRVVFKTPEHATDLALMLSRAWIDRQRSQSPESREAI